MHSFDETFQEETIDVKKIIKKHLYLWPWFALSLLIAFGAAFLYSSSKKPIFQNQLTLLIHDEPSVNRLEDLISNIPISASTSRLQNQVGVLTSRTLVHNTLKALDYGVEYYQKRTLLNHEIYPSRWLEVVFDSIQPQAVGVPIVLRKLGNNLWQITAQADNASLYNFAFETFDKTDVSFNINEELETGKWLKNSNFCFKIIDKHPTEIPQGEEYVIIFRDIFSLSSQFRNNLNVESVRNSTLLHLSVQGNNRRKNEAFLNMLAHQFLERDLRKKVKRTQKTIDFIEDQLVYVSRSLSSSEMNLRDFRSTEQILNIDYQTQRSFEQIESLQQEKAQHLVKESYYDYLNLYLEELNDDDSELLAPASLGVDDPLLSELISQLMMLYAERSELRINSRKDNPLLSNVEGRISYVKNAIRESLSNIRRANGIAISNLDKRIDQASHQISMLPESKRDLFNIERQFNLHDALYTLLQSKKSEVEITQAGLMPVDEIIDLALAPEGVKIAPKKKIIFIFALIIGLALPISIVFICDFFNDNIRSADDIEKMNLYPILGYIARNSEKNGKLLSFKDNSIQAESFRSIRTNSQFVLPINEKPVVMVTSTLLEEGKTFISLNLASSFAHLKKKTVLVSLDLRKPKLLIYLQQKQEVGLSNYLSSNMKPEEVLHRSTVENLDIAFSGPIPPNPAELLNSPKLEDFFDYLQKTYDYIIIDTPPAGMVADALVLSRFANAILYIVRHNKTPLKFLQQTLRNFKDKGISNVNIVVNDTPPPNRSYSYQTYGYQYGYF